MTIQETLAQVRAKYPADPTNDQCAAICNETAWIHRNDPEKWGLSVKNDGENGTLSDGTKVAKDILQNGVTLEIFDVLANSSGTGGATPTWQPKGVLNDPARPWKAPIDPGTTPPDPPDPPDPPSTDYATAAQLEQHDEDIKTAIANLGAALPALVPILTNTLRANLATLEFEGTAKILGMTIRFTLKPKV